MRHAQDIRRDPQFVSIAEQFLNSKRGPDDRQLYLPGGIEVEITQRYLRDGIPLNKETISLIETAGAEFGIDLKAFHDRLT